MTEIPTVTMRDTKTTIMEALKKTTAALQEAKAQQFDPAAAKAQAKTQAAQKRFERRDWDLPTQFAQMSKLIEAHLREIYTAIEKEKREVDAANTVKAGLEKEIQELYGITKEAETFAALVQAKNEYAQKVDAELAEKRVEADEYVANAKTKVRDEIAAEQEAHKRRQAQWEYDFDRETLAKSDALQDKLRLEQKAWADTLEAEQKALAEHKADLAKQAQELTELRAQVEAIPAKLEAAAQEARDKTKRSAAFELTAVKRHHEADLKVLEHQAQTLSAANTTLEAKIKELETKLENAYAQIQGVASKALDAKGSAATTAEVQKAVAAATSGKGR